MSEPLCVITGAAGALGPVVVREFAGAGFKVRALSRRVPDRDLFPSGTDCVQCDILDVDRLSRAVLGADVVVHLAALLHIVNPTASQAHEYERANVRGTSNVVNAARQANVRRVVFCSTIAVYGYGSAEILDEQSVPQPTTPYGATKLRAESVAAAEQRQDGVPLCSILRLAAVYGSRVKGNYRRLIRALDRGILLKVGSGSNRRTLLYERDAARAVLLAAIHPSAAGKVLNVTDGEFHTLDEILAAIAKALDRRPIRFSVPVGPARLAAGLVEEVAALLGRRSPIGRSTIDKFCEDVAVDGSRIMRELGFRPQYGLQKGWAETIEGMRALGGLR